MGLSSKQVSSSGLDWKQTLLEAQNLELAKPNLMKKQQQDNQTSQQSESLKCPRCDSTNTKFCYYNNYNKSQPRHFCRTCKRHWTKGGTLRNVPVGGGRKNKRVKKSTTPASSSTTSTSIGNLDGGLSSHVAIQTTTSSLDQKNISSSSSSLYQALIRPPPPPPLMMNLESRDFGVGNGIFVSASASTLTPFLPQNQGLVFNFSNSSSFVDANSCSVSTSMRSSNVYNYGEEFNTVEEPTINNTTQPWEIPGTNGGAMEASNYWNWEDIDSLVSTDLKDPWDDSDVKP